MREREGGKEGREGNYCELPSFSVGSGQSASSHRST